jgi:hypothetical protein
MRGMKPETWVVGHTDNVAQVTGYSVRHGQVMSQQGAGGKKQQDKRWSERRNSHHPSKYLIKRNLPNVSEIALNGFFAV